MGKISYSLSPLGIRVEVWECYLYLIYETILLIYFVLGVQ